TPDRRVGSLGQGDFFGERALIDQPFRTATVKAVGDVELYALGKGDFDEARAASPSFAEQVRRVYHTLKTS
ncbi:MAG: cyclic nucleotide-binding domain-containing protein, partial [Planctomycetaceae bacterium]|nr:cyclic nucleotide-binding domain-containing protein [Planctomycetaceae bacterium]